LLAEIIIANNVKLHQQVVFGRVYAGKDRVERRGSIDQQFDIIASEKRQFRNLHLDGPLGIGFPVDQCQVLGPQWSIRAAVLDPVGGVVVEKLPAKDHVEKGGGEGQQRQRNKPGDRTLRGSGIEDFPHCANKGEQIDRRHDCRDQMQVRDYGPQDIVNAEHVRCTPCWSALYQSGASRQSRVDTGSSVDSIAFGPCSLPLASFGNGECTNRGLV